MKVISPLERLLWTLILLCPQSWGEYLDYSEYLHLCSFYFLDISFAEFLCKQIFNSFYQNMFKQRFVDELFEFV